MCNPRRVRVRATRDVEEAWEVELERRVRRSDAVVSELEVSFPFGGTLGARTRAVFEQALAGTPGWVAGEDGAFWLDLPDGRVGYRPATGELRVTARLEGVATVEGAAAQRLAGTVTDRVTGTGTGSYFDDGFGGATRSGAEAHARHAAEAEAERLAQELAETVRRRAAEASAAASAQLAGRLEDAAAADAEQRLEEERARLHTELDAANRQRLETLGEEALRRVNGVLAQAYQRALLDYAHEHGARNVQFDESDGVIDIQFEMEA